MTNPQITMCVWCRVRPAVVIYEHADTGRGGPYGTSNGPRCADCTPRKEYIHSRWSRVPELRDVLPEQIKPLDQ